ncbi:LysM peptidoglycan-binding domain-containing protein [Nostoc sp. FACHB-152]|uniref:LysM peptidoglycan-binding domain-containing protein n=1 Tax=unclassified Nostoc TaxID=2593658 RepID=UPI0016836589|nr:MULTISPECIES: LysM peptidoglycan-binding domain-containing protein [unclassified Nostoc]MBD2451463.1 LysM peptidoglycan-binding domain-containing protein [Nostoc sp. FACHB-152]MBD2472504.1 LysM peptidoglycan-binding domain-containing protein [Nostoc sp. FACHB-145]
MSTIKISDLRSTDLKLFYASENYMVDISDKTQTFIMGGGSWETVLKGDSLFLLADIFCGNGNKWLQIYKANRRKIGSNPNLIHPGQRLYIPCA